MRYAILVVAVVAAGLEGDRDVLIAQERQAPASDKRFDVASVKPALSPSELSAQAARTGQPPQIPRFGTQTLPGGRFTASTVTLKTLVGYAFDVRDYQIDGGPKWFTSSYFDIAANGGAEASPEDIRAMLRHLLAERFALRTHTETRQAPLHVLTLARSDGRLGANLKRTTPQCAEQIEQRKNGAAPPPRPPAPPSLQNFPTTPTCGTMTMMSRANGASTILMGGMELASLVRQISGELGGPVVDRSGLSGLFDVTLEYLSERFRGRGGGLDPNSSDLPPPTMMAALQEQLGLKLEKEIGPLPVVVVDAAEPPTPD